MMPSMLPLPVAPISTELARLQWKWTATRVELNGQAADRELPTRVTPIRSWSGAARSHAASLPRGGCDVIREALTRAHLRLFNHATASLGV